MSILNTLRQDWRAYLSPRLWILGFLLLVLCALAVLQFRWIDQVTQAQRQRAQQNLTAAAAGLERDFDIEITRVVASFEFPAWNASEYSERYKEWLRLSPYPGVIHGVYILDTSKQGPTLKEAIPGEPPIRSTDWERQVPKLTLPFQVTTAFPPLSAPGTDRSVVREGGLVRSWGPPNPSILIDGNPTFIFPIVPAVPGVMTQTAARVRGDPAPLVASVGMMHVRGPFPSKWAVVVLDIDYLQSTLLPALLKTHFPNSSLSDYDVLIVDKTRSGAERVLFRSSSAPPEEQFSHPDVATSLFLLRTDCFVRAAPTEGLAVVNTPVFEFGRGSRATQGTDMGIFSVVGEGHAAGKDRLPEILRQKPQSCSDMPVALSTNAAAPWELSVRYRAGSLDQAMATFRRQNLLWSVGVLSILAVGISMLVVLTERARSLAQMQSEFVLGVSHELRTPLTVIRVAADNLRKGMVQDAERAHTYGDIIATHASELSEMIEETLFLARVHSGPPIGKRTAVKPEDIVKSALTHCDSALQDAGIAVEVHLAPHLPLIEADVRLLEGCLQNLIQNVVKYAAAAKWMAVRADLVAVSEGERVQLSVQDRGPGIAAPDLPHIFEPFYRGKRAQAVAAPGMGLGLTLVKCVVEAHLGRIEVHSSERGSSFSLFLRPWREGKGREGPQT